MASIKWISARATEYNFPGSELFLTFYAGNAVPSVQQMALDDGFSKEANIKLYSKRSFLEMLSHTLTGYVILLLEGPGADSNHPEEFIYEIIEGQRSEIYVELSMEVLTWSGYLVGATSFIPTFAYMTAILIFLLAAMII